MVDHCPSPIQWSSLTGLSYLKSANSKTIDPNAVSHDAWGNSVMFYKNWVWFEFDMAILHNTKLVNWESFLIALAFDWGVGLLINDDK